MAPASLALLATAADEVAAVARGGGCAGGSGAAGLPAGAEAAPTVTAASSTDQISRPDTENWMPPELASCFVRKGEGKRTRKEDVAGAPTLLGDCSVGAQARLFLVAHCRIIMYSVRKQKKHRKLLMSDLSKMSSIKAFFNQKRCIKCMHFSNHAVHPHTATTTGERHSTGRPRRPPPSFHPTNGLQLSNNGEIL